MSSRRDRPTGLEVVDSCDGCGACCRFVSLPPYRREFDGDGEEFWERLRRERPDLLAAILDEHSARRAEGAPLYGTPCLWYDPATAGCRHYDLRPRACRQFEVGSVDCLDARRRARIGE
ncbi:MAG: YkgJ family cysteine cluster protein [Isosphaeraceae bacterium]